MLFVKFWPLIADVYLSKMCADGHFWEPYEGLIKMNTITIETLSQDEAVLHIARVVTWILKSDQLSRRQKLDEHDLCWAMK